MCEVKGEEYYPEVEEFWRNMRGIIDVMVAVESALNKLPGLEKSDWVSREEREQCEERLECVANTLYSAAEGPCDQRGLLVSLEDLIGEVRKGRDK